MTLAKSPAQTRATTRADEDGAFLDAEVRADPVPRDRERAHRQAGPPIQAADLVDEAAVSFRPDLPGRDGKGGWKHRVSVVQPNTAQSGEGTSR